jgi:hypothetical protein
MRTLSVGRRISITNGQYLLASRPVNAQVNAMLGMRHSHQTHPPSLVVMVAMNFCYGMLVILQTCHLRTSSELIPNISPKPSVFSYSLLDSFLSVFSVLPLSLRDAAPNHALSRVCDNLSFSRCRFHPCFWPQWTLSRPSDDRGNRACIL